MTVNSLEPQYYVIAADKNGLTGLDNGYDHTPVGPVAEFDGIQTRWMGEEKLPQGRDSAGR